MHASRYLVLVLLLLCMLPHWGRAEVLFQQDFESSNVVTNYVEVASTDPGMFDYITAESPNTALTINNGRLEFSNGAATSGDDWGFARMEDLVTLGGGGGAPILMQIQFEFENSETVGEWGPGATFEVGYSIGTSVSSGSDMKNVFFQLNMRNLGSTNFAFEHNGSGGTTSHTVPYGAYTVRMYLNQDFFVTESYTDPLGGTSTVDPEHASIWLHDGTSWSLIFDDEAANAGLQADLSRFRFRGVGSVTDDAVWSFDNIIITSNFDPLPTGGDDYSTWAGSFNWNGETLTDTGDDPDGDGLNNFTEYALDSSPIDPTPTNRPMLVESGGNQFLRVHLGRADTEVTYTVEFSDDCSDWATITPVVVSGNAGDDVDVPIDLSSGKRFARLKVSQ